MTWTDAQTSGDASWSDLAETIEDSLIPPPVMQTIGFVIFENENYIALTDSIGPNECGHLTKIPKGMITQYNYLPNRKELNDIRDVSGC